MKWVYATIVVVLLLVAGPKLIEWAIESSGGIWQVVNATPQGTHTPTELVNDPKSGPSRFVGRIEFTLPSGELRPDGSPKRQVGTGTLVGPRHVLTAAHVIFDGTPPAVVQGVDIHFIPALDGGGRDGLRLEDCAQPFGSAKVTHVELRSGVEALAASADWHDRRGIVADFVILRVDRDLGSELGGYMKMHAPAPEELSGFGARLNVNGYDALGDNRGYSQYTRSGEVGVEEVSSPILDGTWQLLFRGTWQTEGGCSGGPLWRNGAGGPELVGIVKGDGAGPLVSEFLVKFVADFILRNP